MRAAWTGARSWVLDRAPLVMMRRSTLEDRELRAFQTGLDAQRACEGLNVRPVHYSGPRR